MSSPEEARGTVDLHLHTSRSDGTLTPSAVVRLAQAARVKAIAITDHDTVDGNDEAVEEGRRVGLPVVRGVELSTQWNSITFHLLGYGLRPGGEELRKTFLFLEDCRNQRNPLMIGRLRELGVPVTMDEVRKEAGGAMVGRPHFARVLLRKGVVGSTQEAFERYLGRGAAAFVDKVRLSPADACRLIHEAGGAAVLAHPSLVERDHPSRLAGLVEHLVPLGLAGIEAYYSSHTPEQTASYLALAKRLGLLVTGGSDFHQPGADAGPQLGSGFGNLRVPYSCYLALAARIGLA